MRLVEIRSTIRPNNSPAKLGVAEAANVKNYKTRMPLIRHCAVPLLGSRSCTGRNGYSNSIRYN